MKMVKAKHPKCAPLVRKDSEGAKMAKAMKDLHKGGGQTPCGTYQKMEHAPKHTPMDRG